MASDGVGVEVLVENVKMADSLVVVNVCETHAAFVGVAIKDISGEGTADMRGVEAGLKGRGHDELAVFFGEGEGRQGILEGFEDGGS